jgi:hypothetical protein
LTTLDESFYFIIFVIPVFDHRHIDPIRQHAEPKDSKYFTTKSVTAGLKFERTRGVEDVRDCSSFAAKLFKFSYVYWQMSG